MSEEELQAALEQLDALEELVSDEDCIVESKIKIQGALQTLEWLQTDKEIILTLPVREGLTKRGVQVLLTDTLVLCVIIDHIPVIHGVLHASVVRNQLEWALKKPKPSDEILFQPIQTFQPEKNRRIFELILPKDAKIHWTCLFTELKPCKPVSPKRIPKVPTVVSPDEMIQEEVIIPEIPVPRAVQVSISSLPPVEEEEQEPLADDTSIQDLIFEQLRLEELKVVRNVVK